jgi:hypothetical protein
MATLIDPIVQAYFLEQISRMPTVPDSLIKDFPSDGSSEDFGWLAGMLGIREFGAESIERAFPEHHIVVYNKRWIGGVSIDDTPGRTRLNKYITEKVQGLAQEMAFFKERKFWEKFLLGNSVACWTTATFFNDTHTIDGVTIDNIITGSGVANVAAFLTDLNSVVKQFATFKNAAGNNIFDGQFANLAVIVPQSVYLLAMEAFKAALINGTTNLGVTFGVELIPAAYLEDASLTGYSAADWYAVKKDPVKKPFLRSTVENMLLTQRNKISPLEPTVYEVYSDYGLGYGDPRSIIKVNN